MPARPAIIVVALAFLGLVSMSSTAWAAQGADTRAVQGDPLTEDQRAWLAEHGPLRVGWHDNLPPIAILQDGEFIGGWGFELLELAALKVGVDLEPVAYPSLPSLVEGLATGEIDAIGIMGERADVKMVAESTEPFGWTPMTLVVNDDRDDVRVPGDLTDGTVTTIPGSPLVDDLAVLHPDLRYVPTPSVAEGIAAVAAGDIDAYFGPLAIIGYQLQLQGGRDLRPVGDSDTIVVTSSWASSSSPALEILRTARSLVTENEMAVIHVRWTGFDLTLPDESAAATWVVRGLVIALGLVVVLASISWVLRRRVDEATAELVDYQQRLEDLVDERTEQLAATNHQLQASNDALRHFAGTVAHDLRGPLAASVSIAEAVTSGVLEPQEQAEFLDRLAVGARRAADLVEDMLRAAQNATSDAEARIGAAELEAWLRELLAPQLAGRDVKLSFEASADPVDAPVQPVRQLLSNLVGNALKYAGTSPHISTRLHRDGEAWIIDVDDDGPGIPVQDRERIFRRGVQLDRAKPGVGLGLQACRQLTVALGGSLEYEPSPLGGARFRARLPATSAVR